MPEEKEDKDDDDDDDDDNDKERKSQLISSSRLIIFALGLSHRCRRTATPSLECADDDADDDSRSFRGSASPDGAFALPMLMMGQLLPLLPRRLLSSSLSIKMTSLSSESIILLLF